MKKLFKETSLASFDKLIKQCDEYATEDGCVHYLDGDKKEVYSFDFIENVWMQHSKEYQQRLMHLFDQK